MSSIKIKDDIATPLVTWIKTIHDVPVIWTRPNSPRPKKSYLSVEMTTPLDNPGFLDDIEHVDDSTFNIGGQRTFTVTVNAYLIKDGTNRDRHDDWFEPHDLLEALRDATQNPAAMESLHASGLSVMSVGAILDLTELVETGFESRYAMDLMMNVASNREADLGAIESVVFQGNADGEDEDPVTVE